MNNITPATVLALLLGGLPCGFASANTLHPEVPLLDAAGQPVMESGQPVSNMQSCGGDCHDTAYIESSSDHADAGAGRLGQGVMQHPWQQGPGYFGGWNPLSYDNDGFDGTGEPDRATWLKRFGTRHVGGGPVGEMVEMDCLLCHGEPGSQPGRGAALAEENFAWANSAWLAETGALQAGAGGFRWDATKFQPNGALLEGLLTIRKPRDENCAQCHGQVGHSLDEPLTIAADPRQRHNTERTGQIISPQKLLNSGLNLADKEELSFPFDVHSDRVVGCVNCHYSLNNPVYFRQREESRPAHLAFDPRRLTGADYLVRPLHQFAKGKSTLGLAADGTENSLRRCASCHDAGEVHSWLPFKARHFQSLACESCHVPRLYGPGLQSIDWTMLDGDRQPLRQYRNLQGDPVAVDSLIEGYRPALLPRADASGKYKLAPFNLVTGWYWLAGNPARPLTQAQLGDALFQDGNHHPDLVRALDSDGDGRLAGEELRLDNNERTDAVRLRLAASGLQGVELRGEVIPFPVNHNVVNGRWATRDCSTCHYRNGVPETAFTLSGYRPGGQWPALQEFENIALAGSVDAGPAGGASFVPDSAGAGFYIIGLHGERWVDLLGAVMFLGVVAGVAFHALARYVANRRRPRRRRGVRQVYMYDAYERLWHWLQASVILLLLFTGLVIHKPHLFGMFSFPYIVRVHNVLGFILLINAALALFYNLASGEIRQYLPEPRGFIGRSVTQALYYTRGIFSGQPHPLEKTRERKLNPLQQITYLGILNVLLPAQVITGVLIWGLQKWPGIAASLGGLPALALVHTLVAWAFAAFIVMHVYLTTAAGQTPAAGIRAMIRGWDEVEEHEEGGGILATIRGWDIFDKGDGSADAGGKQGESS